MILVYKAFNGRSRKYICRKKATFVLYGLGNTDIIYVVLQKIHHQRLIPRLDTTYLSPSGRKCKQLFPLGCTNAKQSLFQCKCKRAVFMSHLLATALSCFLYINLINCPACELQITLIIMTIKPFCQFLHLSCSRRAQTCLKNLSS